MSTAILVLREACRRLARATGQQVVQITRRGDGRCRRCREPAYLGQLMVKGWWYPATMAQVYWAGGHRVPVYTCSGCALELVLSGRGNA
jgi:hypothetical protein